MGMDTRHVWLHDSARLHRVIHRVPTRKFIFEVRGAHRDTNLYRNPYPRRRCPVHRAQNDGRYRPKKEPVWVRWMWVWGEEEGGKQLGHRNIWATDLSRATSREDGSLPTSDP